MHGWLCQSRAEYSVAARLAGIPRGGSRSGVRVPLVAADIDVGAISLYSASRARMSGQQVRDATVLSTILAGQILRRVILVAQKAEEDAGRWDSDFSRCEVHQATGMVLAQMHVPPDDALLVLQGHAFATGQPVRDVATDVIARTLDFTPITD